MQIKKVGEFVSNYLLEIICFFLYIITVIFVSIHHEHWYDEIQAYQISKDTIFNIIFQVPHWEGHPPLWHLILKIFSSLGAGLEATLKVTNLLFILPAIFLLIFKSPFPRMIRLILPFTFFLFYQYAVICRPYSLMVLEIFLLAFLYRTKDERPVLYTSVLGLTCLTNPYGMFFATVLTIDWGLEIKGKQAWKQFLPTFVHDRRFHLMITLFILCVILCVEIVPERHVSPPASFEEIGLCAKIIYCLTMLPADSTIFNVLNYKNIAAPKVYSLYSQIAGIWGVMILSFLYCIFKNLRNLRVFILTYIGFLLFTILVYIWPHHTGLLFIITIFCFWVALDGNDNSYKFTVWQKSIIFITIFIQVLWGMYDALIDIYANYSLPRDAAKYIMTNNLDKYKIMAKFTVGKIYVSDFNIESTLDNIQESDIDKYHLEYYANVNNESTGMMINAYAGKNLFFNFNSLAPNKPYILNYNAHPIDSKMCLEQWKSEGLPDIFIVPPDNYIYKHETIYDVRNSKKDLQIFPLTVVYGDSFNIDDYIKVKDAKGGLLWKFSIKPSMNNIYMRKSLYEELKHTLKN